MFGSITKKNTQVKEWLERLLGRPSFGDRLRYYINNEVLAFTEAILKDYGNLQPSHEGLVYWCGSKFGSKLYITGAVAPATISSPGSVSTTHESNAAFVRALSAQKLVHIGQVHSHPGKWVDHSDGDDEWAAFKVKGLLSIVIPCYGKVGMMPLSKCGVHRFNGNTFIRLHHKYVKKRFKIVTNGRSFLKDLRS